MAYLSKIIQLDQTQFTKLLSGQSISNNVNTINSYDPNALYVFDKFVPEWALGAERAIRSDKANISKLSKYSNRIKVFEAAYHNSNGTVENLHAPLAFLHNFGHSDDHYGIANYYTYASIKYNNNIYYDYENDAIVSPYFRTTASAIDSDDVISRVYVSYDSYIRWTTLWNFGEQLGDEGVLDEYYVMKDGDIMTSALTIKGPGDTGAYSQGGFNKAYANIILQGDNTYGISGVVFKSMKSNNVAIGHPSDVAFIQYHPYGVTATKYNTTPTEASSGEKGRFVIGIGNDTGRGTSGDELWLQTPGANDLKHYVVTSTEATGYTILDTGNVSPALTYNGNNIFVTVGGVISSGLTVPYATTANSATTAANANNVKTVKATSNANYYLTFVNSNNSTADYELLYTNAIIFFNPNKGVFGVGDQVSSTGTYSIVAGTHTTATKNNEVAFGAWNNSNTNTLFSIGIGTGTSDKKNAFEVMNNGDARIAGDEYLGMTSGSQCHMQYDNTNKCLNFIFD